MVSPAEFIPIAEESGQIDAIGGFVLAQAMRDASNWSEHLRLAVNLSPVQFRSKSLLPTIAEALRQSGISPGRLEVEITGVRAARTERHCPSLCELHRMGVSVALDDFGTGYSSSTPSCAASPSTRSRSSRSFVSDLPGSSEASAIVKAIIGLGRALKARVTAEGVETWAQLAILEAEGCDDAEGFLFSPCPPPRPPALLRRSPSVPSGRMLGKPVSPHGTVS